MAAIVADTHAALWYLANDTKLSAAAARALDEATASGDPILISAISVVEVTYLVEKGRLPAEARQRLLDALADSQGPYELAALDGEVANAVERIPRAAIPDMPDRIIAATALARSLRLVSRDGRIRASNIETVW